MPPFLLFAVKKVAQSFRVWHRALGCGTELCFCRLCNFDLPNKQRFSLQRHKSCKKLRFLRYSACAEFLDSLLWFVAQSLGFAAFKKAGKFYFLQSSQNIRERG